MARPVPCTLPLRAALSGIVLGLLLAFAAQSVWIESIARHLDAEEAAHVE